MVENFHEFYGCGEQCCDEFHPSSEREQVMSMYTHGTTYELGSHVISTTHRQVGSFGQTDEMLKESLGALLLHFQTESSYPRSRLQIRAIKVMILCPEGVYGRVGVFVAHHGRLQVMHGLEGRARLFSCVPSTGRHEWSCICSKPS